jgi:hypothetical protein
MDGFNQVVRVPGDLNPDPRGLDDSHAQPGGGLKYYQDDFDTNNKQDLATESVTDDPSAIKVQEPGHAPVLDPEDLREAVEDGDEADKEY